MFKRTNFLSLKWLLLKESKYSGKKFLLLFCLILSLTGNAVFAQCTLACQDEEEIALGLFGTTTIIPEMILNGDFSCASPVTIVVYDTNGDTIPNATVSCEHIGQSLAVEAYPNGQSEPDCWMTITIADNFPPQIACQDTFVNCSDPTSPDVMGYPTVTDNCSSIDQGDLQYTDAFTDLECGALVDGMEVTRLISRTWRVFDEEGNLGTCSQTIYLKKLGLSDIVMPAHRNGFDAAVLECGVEDPYDLSQTGTPTINGFPLNNDWHCHLYVTHSDDTVRTCGPGSFKLFREWRISDVCLDTFKFYTQLIKVEDTTPPSISCPVDLNVTANDHACSASVLFAPATATDDCSDTDITVSWAFGEGFGPFHQVPVGIHDAYYIATDLCGNADTCQIMVTIKDETLPTAVCVDELRVSVNDIGEGLVYAEEFDGGSNDNCGIVLWEVKRDDDPFDNFAPFSCADIGPDSIPVTLRVYDEAGNYNDCWMSVVVEDKLPPIITCPPPKTLSCSANTNDLNNTGTAIAFDNCDDNPLVYYIDDFNTNSCNIGTLSRRWIAEDASGNSDYCIQTITLEDNTPIEVYFPADYTTYECGADFDPSITGEPIIMGWDCEDIQYNNENDTYEISDTACFKIIRHWKVINWCEYEVGNPNTPGLWEGYQIIKILDTIPPEISLCPEDRIVSVIGPDCETYVEIEDFIATDCNTYVTITNNSPYADSNGSDASGTYPIGEHTITYAASDQCGNWTTCQLILDVQDQAAPAAVCKNGFAIGLQQEGIVWLSINAINADSYDNCTAADELLYELSRTFFTCDDLGTQFIELHVSDESGNTNSCLVEIEVQDNVNACIEGSDFGAIGGSIITEFGDPIPEVTINLSGNMEDIAYTDDEGRFMFSQLPMYNNYTISPITDTNYREGLSAFDIILIRQHLLGTAYLDSPYKMIAADVNASNSISTYDIVQLQELILGVTNTFPSNNSWRYIDQDFEFTNPNNPFLDDFPEWHTSTSLSSFDLERNFIGVKVGDVNGSVNPDGLMGTSDRNFTGEMVLKMEDIEMSPGLEYRIPVKIQDVQAILGYQFTVELADKLEVVGVEAGDLYNMKAGNFGLSYSDEGIITALWDNSIEVEVNDETVMFQLIVRPKSSVKLSEAVSVNSRITRAEAYTRTMELLNVKLDFENNETTLNWVLEQNYPNPFVAKTSIAFSLPKPAEATLTIFDINGKLLKTITNTYTQGHHKIDLNLKDFNVKAGVMYYQLEVPGYKRLTKKMIILNEG